MSPGRPVTVTSHAIDRAIQRGRLTDHLTRDEIAAWIQAEVRVAFAAGRWSNRKPRWARLYRERKHALPEGQRVVWDQATRVAWVVERRAGEDVVVTTIHRVVAQEAA